MTLTTCELIVIPLTTSFFSCLVIVANVLTSAIEFKMAWSKKTTELEMRVHPISTHESPTRPKLEDAAIEELGHKVTLPRTLGSRLGIIGTISTVVCPWPTALVIAPLCLANGGTGGFLVGFMIAAIFMTLVYYLIAEKISM